MDLELYEHPPFRPPSEAYSLLFRFTRNCPYNKCEFCGMYKGKKFQIRPKEEIKKDILAAKNLVEKLKIYSWKNGLGGSLKPLARELNILWLLEGEVKTVFIGDSNSLVMNTEDLSEIIEFIYQTFPTVKRVTSYARAKTILKKSEVELKKLKSAGLNRLHLGLESGNDEVLNFIRKGATAEEMITAGRKIKNAEITLSEYVILGLGGKERWREHAVDTAKVLNEINPDFIRIRTLFLLPNTPLWEKAEKGEFTPLAAEELLQEEILLLENLQTSSLFLSDHVTNYLNIQGKLPEDKERMINQIKNILSLDEQRRSKILKKEITTL